LLAIIWQAQQEQSATLRRLQEGVDRLSLASQEAQAERPPPPLPPLPPPLELPWSGDAEHLARLASELQRAHAEQQRIAAAAAATAAAAAVDHASEEETHRAIDLALLSLMRDEPAADVARGPLPAAEALIDAVPTLELEDGAAACPCPVCLGELAGVVSLLPCGSKEGPHAFHTPCLRAWLRLHNSCPTCRAQL